MTPQQAPAASTPLPLPQGRTRSRLAAFAQAAARAAIPCCLAAAAAGFAEIAQAGHINRAHESGLCIHSANGGTWTDIRPLSGNFGSICEFGPNDSCYWIPPGRSPAGEWFETEPVSRRSTLS